MSARDVELALTVQRRPKPVAVAPSPLVFPQECSRIFPDFARKLLVCFCSHLEFRSVLGILGHFLAQVPEIDFSTGSK